MKQSHFVYDLQPVYDKIRFIESKIMDEIAEKDSELKSRVSMVVTELLENSIKYGISSKNAENIHFYFSSEPDKLVIKVSNTISNEEHFNNFIEHVDKINQCDNPKDLYVNRLQELMNQKNPVASQLGLYRISYEGNFILSYDCDDNLLTVTATYMY